MFILAFLEHRVYGFLRFYYKQKSPTDGDNCVGFTLSGGPHIPMQDAALVFYITIAPDIVQDKKEALAVGTFGAVQVLQYFYYIKSISLFQ